MCTCSSSNDEDEFCSGVGGIILLLDSGGAFAYEFSNLISACVTVQTRPQIPNQSNTSHSPTNQQPPKEGKQAHQSHQAPHPSLRLTIRQVLTLLQKVFPRRITTTLQISPSAEDINGLHRKITHLLLTLPVSFSSFSSSLLIILPLSSLVSLLFFPHYFFFLFSIIPSGNVLHAWPCILQ